ncbi:9544_t:CDS:2, partial [Entrophospora sp. SA101]
FDPIFHGTKPDLIIRTNLNDYIELMFIEIKPPNTKEALINEDLVYLGKTMKSALDKAIEDGLEDIVICGIQELVDKGVKSYQSIVRKVITPTKSLKMQMTKAASLSPIKVPIQQYDLSGSRNEKLNNSINTTSGSRNE